VGVLLALLVGLLSSLELRVLVVALVASLVDARLADRRVSRHDGDCWLGYLRKNREMLV